MTPITDIRPCEPSMRNYIYDNIKGIGILLVVLGHVSIAPELVRRLIFAFHMPMFFMLSGYLFDTEKKCSLSTKYFIMPRLRRLYLPALVIGFLCSIPSIVFGHTDTIYEFARRSFGVVYSIPKAQLTFNSTPLWFLTCLLCVEFFYFNLVKYAKANVAIFVFSAFLLSIALSEKYSFFSPLNSHIALSGLMFFYLGSQLKNYTFIESHRPRFSCFIVAGLALLVSTYLNPTTVDMASNNLGGIHYLFIGVASGSYLVFFLSKKIGPNFAIGTLGRNTILILGFNYWAYFIVDKCFRFFGLPYNWVINFIAQALLFFALSLVVQRVPLLDLLIQGNKKPRPVVEELA